MKRILITLLVLLLPISSLAEVDLNTPKSATYNEFLARFNAIDAMYNLGRKFTPVTGTIIKTELEGKKPFIIKHKSGTVRGLTNDGNVDSFTVTPKFPGDVHLIVVAVGSLLPKEYFEQHPSEDELVYELPRTLYLGEDETLTLSGYRIQVSNKNDYGIPSEFIIVYLGDAL